MKPLLTRTLAHIAALLALLALIPGALHRGLVEAVLMGPQVSERLAETGVQSKVTAVLLDFRALDTLLEVTVLAAAAVGTLALPPPQPPARRMPCYSLLPSWLIPRLAPLIFLLVAYLWWAGSSRPGGAFQAGASLTGVLLLLYFVGRIGTLLPRPGTGLRLAVAGPLLFLAIGLLPLATGAVFLDHPEAWSKALILTIEAGLTVAIGGALGLLATGGGDIR